jgi:hypothetical protein
MPKKLFLLGLMGKPRGVEPQAVRPPKFDENYPAHISTWASKLKSSVEGLRDDSTDLQEKYRHAPTRRKPRPKSRKREQ